MYCFKIDQSADIPCLWIEQSTAIAVGLINLHMYLFHILLFVKGRIM